MARVGAVVFVVSFAAFAFCAAPGLYLRDSGELTTAAFTLGVAHETGFALFCLLGKAATLIPLGEVAFRVNLLSASCGALAVYFCYRVILEALDEDPARDEPPPDGSSIPTRQIAVVIAAAMGGFLACAGLSFFRSSTVAEVYAPTAAAIALALYLAVRASRGDRHAGPLLALVGGISLGLHAQLRVIIGPAVAIWALWRLRRGDRWPLFGPAAIALGAGVTAYLPLRAARDPAANWAHPQTLATWFQHLGAARIRSAFAAQILTHDSAFVAHHLREFVQQIEGQLGLPLLLAALFGLWSCAQHGRSRFLGVLLLVVLVSDALYSSLVNPMGMDDLQDGMPSLLVLGIAAGIGLGAVALRLGRGAPWASAVFGVVCLVPAALADSAAKTGLGSEAAVFTEAAMAEAPARALVLTTSDDLSAGILYEQVVAGARPDLTALVRQQLWDGALVRRRIWQAGGAVHDPAANRSDGERLAAQDRLLRSLIHRESAQRAILWEPGSDLPAEGILEPAIPLYRWSRSPSPLPAARPLAERIDQLLGQPRDPFVRKLAASTLSGLGRVYYEAGDSAHAGALFQSALGLDPGDPAAATNLAVVLATRGDYRAALALVTTVLAADPTERIARVNAGRYQLQLGELDGAEHHFAYAHARSPGDAPPLVGLARVAARRNDRAAALRFVSEALRLHPDDGEARLFADELKRTGR